MAFLHPLMLHLLLCGNMYFEMKASSPELERASFVCMELPTPYSQPYNITGEEEDKGKLPVKLPRSGTTTYALIDPEDKDRLSAISKIWRISSSGYIMTSKRTKGKYRMFYLHKEVLGQSGTHLNGNRLDNRKSNLAPVKRQRRVQDLEEDFVLRSIQPLADFPLQNSDLIVADLQHATVSYSGGKTYKGELRNYKPHGIGKLIEIHPVNKETYGLWKEGKFESGVVTRYKSLPPYLRQETQDLSNNPVIDLCIYVDGICYREVRTNGSLRF